MLQPLHESLESWPTLERVYRHLNIRLSKKQRIKVSKKVSALYKQITNEEPKRMYGRAIYPVEFIPVMINIVKARILKKPES